MIIQRIASICINDDRCVKNTALALDWTVAISLLVIGILGACGILSIPSPVAFSFLGAGIVYTLIMCMEHAVSFKCEFKK